MAAGRVHHYGLQVEWQGNRGSGTSGYTAYDRTHAITAPGKPPIPGSADPAFRGDAACWNPEELLLASLSACHQLWYLHLAASAGIIVSAYHDDPVGEMVETADGGGAFASVTLRPTVVLADPAQTEQARALHHDAHALCYIARSVNFPVRCEPR